MALVEVNWKPDRKQLRGFGFIALVAFGALAGWVLWRHSLFGFTLGALLATRLSAALAALAGLCGLLAALFPPALRPLYVVLTAIGLPIGWVVSHVLLAVVFYGVITPIGLFLRLSGRDLLERRFDREARSYWRPRPRVNDARRYFRQY